MKKVVSVGSVVMAIGLLHQVVGVLFGIGALPAAENIAASTPLLDIARDGFVGAIEPHTTRMVFFWFVMTGFSMITTGWLAHTLEQRGALPTSFAFAFGAFSLGGALLIPASGFWLGLLPALLAWRRSRRAEGRSREAQRPMNS